MDPATFCVSCGDVESDLFGPVPGTDDDFLCLPCAIQWGEEHGHTMPHEHPRIGAQGPWADAAVEVLETVQQGGSGLGAAVVEFGAVVPTPCEHTHVDALHRAVQPWN